MNTIVDPDTSMVGPDHSASYGRSRSVSSPVSGSSTPTDVLASRSYRQTMRPSDRKPNERSPITYCGYPNSASAAWSTVRSPSRTRSRFHHPLRSDANTRSPDGLHSGSQIDSSAARPAPRDASPSSASDDRSATNNSVPSHGIHGRSHSSHASRSPSSVTRGDE